MTVQDLKLYKLFYNSNGYLSLVYRETSTHFSIINFNGSIYEINKLTHSSSYNEIGEDEKVNTPGRFFDSFPLGKIEHNIHSCRNFDSMVADYHTYLKSQRIPNKKLLLLLTI